MTDPGEPVDSVVRRRVEQTTGADLGHVRIHDDVEGHRLVARQGGRGLTIGGDVALASGLRGVEREIVLRHELAHAAQQRDPRHGSNVSVAADEAEADRVAVAATLGQRVPVSRRSGLELRSCDEPPPAVKQAASKTDPAKLSGFESMVKGGVPAADAADKMQLPTELRDAMAAAWKNSFPGAKSKEQGGLLVKKSDGSLDFVKATKTTSGSTTLPWDSVPKGATPIVAAHTHPYDKSEGGHQGVMFSGGDLGNLVTDSTRVKVVHAGDRYFAVTKTKEFEDQVAKAKDKAKLRTQISSEWDTLFTAAKGDIPARARAATTAIAAKYHLVLYEGKLDGALKKLP
jgi:hypothetical protein